MSPKILLSCALLVLACSADRIILRSINCPAAVTMNIDCSVANPIRIKNANYGRTTQILRCGISPNNCTTPNSQQQVIDRCEGVASCSIPISKAEFGDSCPGIPKYLDVEWACGGSSFIS